MKLKYKFIMLIAGIVIVPLIFTFIIIYINIAIDIKNEPAPSYFRIMSWLIHTFPDVAEGEPNNNALITTPPPEGLFFLMIDPDSKIVLSNTPDYKIGDNVDYMDAIQSILKNNEDYRLVVEYREFEKYNENGILILGIKKITHTIDEGLQRMQNSVYIFLGLLIIISVFGIIMVNSVSKAITKLESATKRIASGDLDFKLKIKGNDEISSLEKSFNVMREKLKDEMVKRSRFLMAVSHDLSTPLTSIKGYVEAIQDGFAENKDELDKYISIIKDKTELLAYRISELIDFVKMEKGEWKMKLVEENFYELLLSVAKIYKDDSIIFKRNFSYNIDVPKDIKLSVDKNLIIRALENLFNNAIRYTEENDTIIFNASFISDKVLEKKLLLEIIDSGVGINKKEIKQIFDPFYRGNNFNNKKGFGIGLSSVKSIVEAHGWSIDVQSEPGKGSTFFINILFD